MKVAISSAFWDNPSGRSLSPWLARMSALGFDGVTLFTNYWVWGDTVRDGQSLHVELNRHQMQLASLVSGVHLDFERYRHLIGVLQALGCRHLVLIGGSGRESGDRRALAGVLNRVGRIAASGGVIASYHHHTDTSGESFHDVLELLSLTDPSLVQLAFDSGHAALDFCDIPAAGRPVAALGLLWERIGIVELKDYSAATGLDTALGEGIVDLEQLVAELTAREYAGWVVIEQNPECARSDPDRDSCARRSLERLNSLTAGNRSPAGRPGT
jgi:sugar phosphate isomerase/epimerase